MIATHQLTEEDYIKLVFASPDRQFELYDGEVREKPGMSWEHGRVAFLLNRQLSMQLDPAQFSVSSNDWRVRRPTDTIFIPDLCVVPIDYGRAFRGRPGTLAIFRDPLPLVVEIWSRSTGDYDVNAKIPEYKRRGDLEIWRIQPYEQSITVWRRQPDGAYAETIYHEGIIQPATLPNVTIALAELFDNS